VNTWISEKIHRLVFVLDALFEAIQTLGVIAIILGARRAIVWLAQLTQASDESKEFVSLVITGAEILLVVGCFGVNIPFVIRDIRAAWGRAMKKEERGRPPDNTVPPAPNAPMPPAPKSPGQATAKGQSSKGRP